MVPRITGVSNPRDQLSPKDNRLFWAGYRTMARLVGPGARLLWFGGNEWEVAHPRATLPLGVKRSRIVRP